MREGKKKKKIQKRRRRKRGKSEEGEGEGNREGKQIKGEKIITLTDNNVCLYTDTC